MRPVKTFTIGLVYIGSTQAFLVVDVRAYTLSEAFTRAAGYLKPNHMQTLTQVTE